MAGKSGGKPNAYGLMMERFDRIGEPVFFDTYLTTGSVLDMLVHLGFEYRTAHRPFYFWLHAEDDTDGLDSTRWERWQETKRLKAHAHIDKISQLVGDVTSTNYQQRRVEMSGHQYLAEKLSPKDYGKLAERIEVKAELTLADVWLRAFGELDQPKVIEAEVVEPPALPDES